MLNLYICPHCGNISILVKDKKVPLMCCGTKMNKIKANTTEAATEKHIPVVEKINDQVKVTVGETLHPMLENHYIEFIALETSSGIKINYLKPNTEPSTTFVLTKGEKLKKAYAYCNLHSLWSNK